MKSVLQEMIGLGTMAPTRPSVNHPNPRFTTSTTPLGNTYNPGITVGPSATLEGWQTQIVMALKSGKDPYVIAKPSAGKTAPIVTYWAEKLLSINPRLLSTNEVNNPQLLNVLIQNIQYLFGIEPYPNDFRNKLLIVVPTRSLARNTYADFIEHFTNIISQAIRLVITKLEPMEKAWGENSPSVITMKNTYQGILSALAQKCGDSNLGNNLQNLTTQLLNIYNEWNVFNSSVKQFKDGYDQQSQNQELQNAERQLNLLQQEYNINPHMGLRNQITIQQQHIEDLRNQLNADIQDINNAYYNTNVGGQSVDNMNQSKQHLEKQYAVIKEQFDKTLGQCVIGFIKSNLVHGSTASGPMGDAKIKDALVTVTIYEKAMSIYDEVKNKLGLLVIDEAHLTQEQIDQEDTRPDQICNSLYYLLRRISNNTRLAFLSGTVNPDAAKNLSEYLQFCFNRKIEVINTDSPGNKSDISIVAANWLKDNNELLKLLIKPHTNANLIIIFGKYRIKELVEQAISRGGGRTAANVDTGAYQNRYNVKSASEGRFNKTTPNKYSIPGSSFNTTVNKVPGADQIRCPILRQAVFAGFGYIFRQTQASDPFFDPDMSDAERDQDQRIVEILFAQGKIRTLLATDAVGIGVTLKVQNMFILSTNKRGTNKQGVSDIYPMDLGDLSQLLNRTGRGKFRNATIYAPDEYIPTIQAAQAAGPEQFSTRITIEKLPKTACAISGIFKSLWKNVINYR